VSGYTASARIFSRFGCGALAPVQLRAPSSHHQGEKLSNNLYSFEAESVAATASIGAVAHGTVSPIHLGGQPLRGLYTAEQRARRDATAWTLVQAVLAPAQFVVFLVSLALVVRYLASGDGLAVATGSIVAKTLLLYAIMITGSIWEREVFGCYLFAPAFFWEDVFSFLVLGLHTAYLAALLGGLGDAHQQMLIALAAYASYLVNATQFVLKLRAARHDACVAPLASDVSGSGA
jgi:3-vinyl bacteriochlorophyllide hydratase